MRNQAWYRHRGKGERRSSEGVPHSRKSNSVRGIPFKKGTCKVESSNQRKKRKIPLLKGQVLSTRKKGIENLGDDSPEGGSGSPESSRERREMTSSNPFAKRKY